MTQADLAQKLKISRGYLNAILRGKKYPGLRLAKAISKETGIPILNLNPRFKRMLRELLAE